MSNKDKGGDTPKKDERTPADKLLIDFIKDNKLTLVVDEVTTLSADIPDTVYVAIKRPRVRAFYLDDIKNLEQAAATLDKNAKVDIIN